MFIDNAELTLCLGSPATWAEPGEDGPEFGVVDPETGDIIGAGDTPEEAIADALETAHAWL